MSVFFEFINDGAGAAWTPAEQATYQADFIASTQHFWSGRYQFQTVKAPQDVWSELNPIDVAVNVQVNPGAGGFRIAVHKNPSLRAQVGFEHLDGMSRYGQPGANPNQRETLLVPGSNSASGEFEGHIQRGEVAKVNRDIFYDYMTANPKNPAEIETLQAYLAGAKQPKMTVTITSMASSAEDIGANRPAPGGAPPSRPGRLGMLWGRIRSGQSGLQAAKYALDRDAYMQSKITGLARTNHTVNFNVAPMKGASQDWQKSEVRAEVDPNFKAQFNTTAHEFGHMLGLADEYYAPDQNLPGQPGTAGAQYTLAVEALGKSFADAHSMQDPRRVFRNAIMSAGNEIRPQHYTTLWDGLTRAASAAPKPMPGFQRSDWKFVGV